MCNYPKLHKQWQLKVPRHISSQTGIWQQKLVEGSWCKPLTDQSNTGFPHFCYATLFTMSESSSTACWESTTGKTNSEISQWILWSNSKQNSECKERSTLTSGYHRWNQRMQMQTSELSHLVLSQICVLISPLHQKGVNSMCTLIKNFHMLKNWEEDQEAGEAFYWQTCTYSPAVFPQVGGELCGIPITRS